jgi:hypothetical protein
MGVVRGCSVIAVIAALRIRRSQRVLAHAGAGRSCVIQNAPYPHSLHNEHNLAAAIGGVRLITIPRLSTCSLYRASLSSMSYRSMAPLRAMPPRTLLRRDHKSSSACMGASVPVLVDRPNRPAATSPSAFTFPNPMPPTTATDQDADT